MSTRSRLALALALFPRGGGVHWLFLFPLLAGSVFALEAPKAEPPALTDYKAPPGRSPDMQMFDRAALYLSSVQEDDGHWDSAKLGAAPEFRNFNGDLANTAIATYVLMCTSSGNNQNPVAVAHARKAMRWMAPRLRENGAIADPAGPGEPVVAQLLAGAAFMQAAAMSTRDTWRQNASRTMNYALFQMKSKGGGYGPSPGCEHPRADVLGLAAFVFKSASLDGYKFELPGAPPAADPKSQEASIAGDDDILNTLRNGFKALDTGGAKPAGVFAAQPGGAADWNATVACMLANFLINPQRAAVTPALDFVFGELDKKSQAYPHIPAHIAWGQSGEGYDAMTAWQGTMAVVYLFTDDKNQYKTWVENYRTLLHDHQRADGAWDAAGTDAQRGTVWRTAIQAMTLILTAPPPPPPVPN